MALDLTIIVVDIGNVIAQYDQIKVLKGRSKSGPFTEITAADETEAALTGTEAGPFANIVGLTLIIRTKTGTDQTVTFFTTGTSIANVITDCNNAFEEVTASNSGSDELVLSTDGVGTDEILLIVGGTALAELGFVQDDYDVGEAARVALVANQTAYLLKDPYGQVGLDFYITRFYNSGTQAESTDSLPEQGDRIVIYPEKYSDSEAPRGLTLLRGETHTFNHAFFADSTRNQPLVPKDPANYPSVEIVDVDGQIVATAVAELDGSAGYYKYNFTVPVDAAISEDDRRWQARWYMLTTTNRQVEAVVEFDVRDVDVSIRTTAGEQYEHKLMFMGGVENQLSMVRLSRPYSVEVKIGLASSDTWVREGIVYPFVSDPDTYELVEAQHGETYIYSYDVPAQISSVDVFEAGTVYTVLWTFRETATSAYERLFQTVTVPPRLMFSMMQSLRQVIDKQAADRAKLQAYRDSDLYEYILQGQNIINAWHPYTTWTISGWPAPLGSHLMLASALYGLNAQHLLETNLQFGFGGQTVTLDYDHTGNLDSAIGRMWSWLEATVPPAKSAVVRRTAATGIVGVRPLRLDRLQDYVMKARPSYYGNSIPEILTTFGLL
jgi:hypothetical protein